MAGFNLSPSTDTQSGTFPSPSVVARHPARFGVACAIGCGLFAVVFIFSERLWSGPRLDTGDLIWLGLLAVAAGIGGWSIALGRRTAAPALVVLGLVTIAMPAASREIPLVANLLDRIGLRANSRSWWRWVDTGDATASSLVTPGALAGLLLAGVCAVIGWRVRERETRSARQIHPLLPAAAAASMPIVLAIGPGYDPALTPFLAAYAAMVGMGAAAVTIAAHRRRIWLMIGGWATVAVLPIFHGIGLIAPFPDQWAPTLLHDLFGVLVTIIAAFATMVGLLRIWRTERRQSPRAASRGRTGATVWYTLLLVALLAASSCESETGVGSTTSTAVTTTTTHAAPTTSTPATTTTSPTAPMTSTTSTIPVSGEVPPLLVAHQNGIELWTPTGSSSLLTGRSIAVAVPDLQGGLLFQETQDEFEQAVPIEWLPATGGAPQILIEGDDAFMLTLVQVARIDTVPTVVFRRWVELPNDCSVEDLDCRWDYHRENLMLRDLDGGTEHNLGGIGSFESDIFGLHVGGDRVAFALNRYEGGACAGWFPLTGIADTAPGSWIGEGFDLEERCVAGPTPWCPAGERCEGMARAAASPDGALVAYAFSDWRPGTGEHLAPTLVIHDPVAGSDVLRIEVGEAGVQPSWLDFDGQFALLGRNDTRLSGEDTLIEALLVDMTGRTLPIPIAGRATLWSSGSQTTSGPLHHLPVDDDWTVTSLAWPIQPSCCDTPALGPASPPGPIPEAGSWPDIDFSHVADGFYDATITRVWDPPGVVALSLRRWIACTERPAECPADSPQDGIFADPATQVDSYLVIGEGLTVVIQPLQTWRDGRYPDPPQVITGSGTAFLELLRGFCGGYLPEPNPENCGIDHAFLDWVWYQYQAGESVDAIIAELEASNTGPTFPFTEFDDRATEVPCWADRRCVTAYRGPQGTHLIVDFSLLDSGENWPERLYGWWTSLEIRDGKPILYIDAGRLAG